MLEDVFKDPHTAEPPPAPPPPGRKSRLPGPAYLLPFLFLVLLGSIVYLFGLLSFDARSPRDLLEEVRTSAGERRAMAAFELSRVERYGFSPGERSHFVSDATRAFGGEAGKDLRVRRALALTLGRVGDPLAVPELIGALEDPDVETQLYGIWALGAIGARSAVVALLLKLQHEDPGIRKMAAFGLGQIGDPGAASALRVALQDPAPDVTWNAAVALARLGDPSSLPVLLPLLLAPSPAAGLPPQQSEELKVNIIRSLGRMRGEPVDAALRKTAAGDPSLRVRGEARRLLEGRPEPLFPPPPPGS